MADKAKVVAVFGRHRRAGRWKIAGHTLVVAVFGHCQLDLTSAIAEQAKVVEVDEEGEEEEQEEQVLSISVLALFGSVSFLFAPGSLIRPSGVAVLSAASVDMPLVDDPNARIPIDLDWIALFSRVRVAEGQQEDQQAAAPSLEPVGVEPHPRTEATNGAAISVT